MNLPVRFSRPLALIGRILKGARNRRITGITVAIYLLVYLYSLQQLVLLPAAGRASYPVLGIQVAADWLMKLWRPIAPFSYEPIAAVYLARRVAVFLAVPNLLLGLLLGALVGLNLAVAVMHYTSLRACPRPGVGLFGTLPSLFTGFTCCVPTVALALGANSALALIALRSYFIPVSLLLLILGLLWGATRLLSRETAPAHPS